MLGAGEAEGEGGVKGGQVGVFVGEGFLPGPGCPKQGQPRAEDEKLLKDQTPAGLLRLLHGFGLVDGGIGKLRRENVIALADGFRQNLPGGIADGQGLLDAAHNGGVVQPGGKGVDGQNPPGGGALGGGTFEDGIGHAIAAVVPGDGSVKDVRFAVMQVLFGIPGIEEGQVQPPGGVRHLHPGQIQTLADVGGAGGVHHHRLEAGRTVYLQLADGNQPGTVLVAPGVVADQILQRVDIQIVEQLCPGRANAPQDGNGIRWFCQIIHRLDSSAK